MLWLTASIGRFLDLIQQPEHGSDRKTLLRIATTRALILVRVSFSLHEAIRIASVSVRDLPIALQTVSTMKVVESMMCS